MVLAFIALFGIFKITNRNESMGFQDFLIEKIFHKGGDTHATTNTVMPVAPIKPEPQAPAFNDLLSHVPASVEQSVAVFDPLGSSAPVEDITPEQPATIPDWLKGTTDRLVEEKPVAPVEIPQSTPAESVALPSWLSGTAVPASESEMPTTQEVPAEENIPDVSPSEVSEEHEDLLAPVATQYLPIEEPEETISAVSIPEAVSEFSSAPAAPMDDLPDWLKELQPATQASLAPVETAEAEEIPTEKPAPKPKAKSPTKKKAGSITDTPILPPTTNMDDLPDWLK